MIEKKTEQVRENNKIFLKFKLLYFNWSLYVKIIKLIVFIIKKEKRVRIIKENAKFGC